MRVHHHHDVMLLAQISLSLSHLFSLSFIASGWSSGLHPVSSHSCCMYVRAGRPAFARPYVGVHRSTSLYTRMLRAILNKSWRQHPTRHQLYGHLPPIMKTIQLKRTRHGSVNNKMSIMFNEICINEEMLPKYTYFQKKICRHNIHILNSMILQLINITALWNTDVIS